MATKIIYDCKCCGGNLEGISEGLAKCESCRKRQSIPVTDNLEMVNRANRLRSKNKNFDEARKLYEKVIAENPDEAECYWGVVLCRYGIEYMDDKTTSISFPRCHRTIETSIMDDADYIKACEKANEEVRRYYNEQAEYIDEVQKKMMDVAVKQKPHDVFVLYLEKDKDGIETLDSREALKIYNRLDKKGYKVFFAEESLKDISIDEREPYVYAALKSAKVMILIGSSEENLDSPWVRNAWARYQSMIDEGEDKRFMTFYYDMDPYSLPQDLLKSQALNWKDATSMQILVATVDEALGYAPEVHEDAKQEDYDKALAKSEKVKVNQQLRNAVVLLNSGNREAAIKELTELIKVSPEISEAYWVRMLARLNESEATIALHQVQFEEDPDFLMAMNTASKEEQDKYTKILESCKANRDLQVNYNKDRSELIERYSALSTNEDIKNAQTRMNEILDEKAFVLKPIAWLVKIISFLVVLIVGWLILTGGTVTELREGVGLVMGISIAVVAIIAAIAISYHMENKVIGIGITVVTVAVLLALFGLVGKWTFAFAIVAFLGASVGLGITININSNKKSMQQEYEMLLNKYYEALKAWNVLYKAERERMNNDYLNKAYDMKTGLKVQEGKEIANILKSAYEGYKAAPDKQIEDAKHEIEQKNEEKAAKRAEKMKEMKAKAEKPDGK